MICNNCGVELEENMQTCPLCGAVAGTAGINLKATVREPLLFAGTQMSQPQKKFTWEIISLILLSGVIATFIVDFIIHRDITWSEYTASIGLSIFCYISLFAFWDQSTHMKITGGFLLSSICLLILDIIRNGFGWPVKLAIPLLFIASLIAAILISIFRRSRSRGVNLIAYTFLGAAMMCIAIEGILSFYKTGLFHFQWSIIATACIVPVVLVLIFIHFRLRKGRSLEKTFHI